MLTCRKVYAKHLKTQALKGTRSFASAGTVFDNIQNRKKHGFYCPTAFNDEYEQSNIHMRKFYDINSHINGRMGYLQMNRHHKFNIFTKHYLEQLIRVTRAMELADETMHAFQFSSVDPKTFSYGTDFKTIHHHAKNKDMDPIVEYFNTLYNFHVTFARCNKPLLLTAQGAIENSAACLVGGAGISCITNDATIKFNDTSAKNRMVPHSGASFYLTRMTGELGTFLALTGIPFTGGEAKEILGLAEFILTPGEEVNNSISFNLRDIDKSLDVETLHGTDGIKENVSKFRLDRIEKHCKDMYLYEKRHRIIENPKFIPPWEAKEIEEQKISEKIDMQYKDYLRDNLYYKVLYDKSKLGSGTTGHYINHYKHAADFMKEFLPFEAAYIHESFLKKYENDINRTFHSNTLEEIKENLKNENTKFSQFILDILSKNDPVAMDVTLSLLRKATKCSLSECMHLELKAALNLLKNENEVTAQTPITKELIEGYFNTPAEYKHVNLEIKDHAPLPTRDYYDKYADHMRLLMNEHSSEKMAIRTGYDREVQSELREVGIDIRDSGLTPQIIRTSLWKKEYAERALKYAEDRKAMFLNDDLLTERYYSEIAGLIEKLSSSTERWSDKYKDYYDMVNHKIQDAYVQAVMKNLEFMKERNTDLHKIKKHRFLIKLKKFFFENRLIDNYVRREIIENLRIEALPNVPLNFSQDIYDNRYSSYDKLKSIKTSKELDEVHEEKSTYNSVEQKIVPLRQRKRTLILTNGFDPTTTSEYYDEYMRLKSLREEYERRFEERQKKRIQERERLNKIMEESFKGNNSVQKDMAKSLVEEELSITRDNSYKNIKSLNDIISCCVNENEGLLFLSEIEPENPEPKIAKEFRSKIKDLLSKYIQISLINSVNQKQGESINLMNSDKSQKFEFLDGLLSDKVNSSFVQKVVENIKPALCATTNKSIEEEARKILYAFDYKENLSNILTQLYESEKFPEHLHARYLSHYLLEHFKDDPEVLKLLKERPANGLMYKGKQNPNIIKKVHAKMMDLMTKNPIEILKVILESIIKTEFDITYGDSHKEKDINFRLNNHFGPLNSPIQDTVKYGALLVMAHDFMNSQQSSEVQTIESCINLLGNSKEVRYEVDQLIKSIHKDLISKEGNSNQSSQSFIQSPEESESILSDFLQRGCDVETLGKIKESCKGLPSSSDVGVVIDYINHTLQHTPNLRRKNISIKDFLNRDSNINLEFVNNVADCILKEQTRSLADKVILYKEAGLSISEVDLLSEDVKQLLQDTIDERKVRVIDKRTLQSYNRLHTKDSLIDEKIKQDISNAVTMSDDLEYTRAKMENDLIETMMFKTDAKEEINNKVKEWIKLRIIDLKTKPEYKLLCESEFKTQLIDKFKQEIISELGLNNFMLDHVNYEAINPLDSRDKTAYKNDIANKNNLNYIMENALGYDNLIERLQDPDNSASLAQSNYFEKMLAEYYIDKRKDYKASKDMLNTLNTIFNVGNIYNQSQRIGEDLDVENAKISNPYSYQGLNGYSFMAFVNKEKPVLLPEDVSKLIELGDSTNHAMYGEIQGVAENLAKYNSKENTWPERLSKFDVRRTPKEWVEEKCSEVIKKIFSAREKVEQNLTRNELKAYDKEIAHHFNKETMILRLLDELDLEYAELSQKKIHQKMKNQDKIDKEIQDKKAPNRQLEYNNKIKNVDAAYKLIAYRIAKKYNPNLPKKIPPTAFIHYYETQLQRDIFEPPRPIVENDYKIKSKEDKESYKLPLTDNEYFDEYQEYKRNRLETYNRIDTYEVLDAYHKSKELNESLKKDQKEELDSYFRDKNNMRFQ